MPPDAVHSGKDVRHPKVAVGIQDEGFTRAVGLGGRRFDDGGAEFAGRLTGRIRVAAVETQFGADSTPVTGAKAGVERVTVIGVVGMHHPRGLAKGKGREVHTDVLRRRSQHTGVERHDALDITRKKIDGQSTEPPGIVGRGHPPVFGVAENGQDDVPFRW